MFKPIEPPVLKGLTKKEIAIFQESYNHYVRRVENSESVQAAQPISGCVDPDFYVTLCKYNWDVEPGDFTVEDFDEWWVNMLESLAPAHTLTWSTVQEYAEDVKLNLKGEDPDNDCLLYLNPIAAQLPHSGHLDL